MKNPSQLETLSAHLSTLLRTIVSTNMELLALSSLSLMLKIFDLTLKEESLSLTLVTLLLLISIYTQAQTQNRDLTEKITAVKLFLEC